MILNTLKFINENMVFTEGEMEESCEKFLYFVEIELSILAETLDEELNKVKPEIRILIKETVHDIQTYILDHYPEDYTLNAGVLSEVED